MTIAQFVSACHANNLEYSINREVDETYTDGKASRHQFAYEVYARDPASDAEVTFRGSSLPPILEKAMTAIAGQNVTDIWMGR